MFKSKFIVFLLFITVKSIHAQDKQHTEDVMASIICECLENTPKDEIILDFDEKIKSCHNASVLGSLLSNIPKDEDSTITLNTDGTSDEITQEDTDKAFEILIEECAIYNEVITEIQNINANVTTVAQQACDCISTIDTSIPQKEKNNAIQNCTQEAIAQSGVRDQMNLNTVEAIQSFYAQVSKTLINSCEALEIIAFSDDEEKLNSYSTDEKAIAAYNKGIDESREKNYRKAVKHYRKAVTIDSSFVFAWDNLGRSLRELHQYDEAIDAYKKSIALDSLNRTSLMNIAVAFNYKKDFTSAAVYYEKIIAHYPEDPEGHYGLSLCYMNNEEIEKALDSVISAYFLYQNANSPYTADAKKVMDYLYNSFKSQDKSERFLEICAERKIDFRG